MRLPAEDQLLLILTWSFFHSRFLGTCHGLGPVVGPGDHSDSNPHHIYRILESSGDRGVMIEKEAQLY